MSISRAIKPVAYAVWVEFFFPGSAQRIAEIRHTIIDKFPMIRAVEIGCGPFKYAKWLSAVIEAETTVRRASPAASTHNTVVILNSSFFVFRKNAKAARSG